MEIQTKNEKTSQSPSGWTGPEEVLLMIDQDAKKKGFTLIELSIVLVIIGLIVGGILVGQDLIRAAEIRATVGQIEKYNSAVNTFRTKYNGIPGDLTSDSAAAFGFVTRAGTAGEGDGNGLIDGNGTTTNQALTQEGGLFWNDMSVANLLDGSYTSNAANTDVASVPAITAPQVSAVFPPARLARGNYVAVGSTGSTNYWMIAGIAGATTATGAYSLTTNLTPIELYNMDVKMDDGLPLTGIVQAHGTAASTTSPMTDGATSAATSTITKCEVGDTVGTAPSNTYNRGLTTGGNAPLCMGRFRFN